MRTIRLFGRAMNDQELIAQIKFRDQDAMVALYTQYADLIYSITYRVLNEKASVEECVQDTFMKVWQSISQFDAQRGPFVAWLIGIARNLAIDRLRKWARQAAVIETQTTDDNDNLPYVNLPDNWQDRERADNLRFAMQSLPPEQLQVLALSYFGGMTQNEIAEYLAIPLGTVKTRMRLGMQKLREAWLEEEENA